MGKKGEFFFSTSCDTAQCKSRVEMVDTGLIRIQRTFGKDEWLLFVEQNDVVYVINSEMILILQEV